MKLSFRPSGAELTDDLAIQIERWFIRRGVPHFIDQYNAREDIFTRASGTLSLWFLIAMTGFSPFDSPRENVVNLLVGLTVLALLLIISNRRAGRSLLSVPSSVGAPSLTIFVLLPALVRLIGGIEPVEALATVGVQLAALLLIYLGTSYAVGPLTYWAVRSLFEELGAMFGLFARALPLLMLITIVMFISAETWQAASGAPTVGYIATMTLFVVAGLIFLTSRLPREIDNLVEPLDWEHTTTLAQTTPVAGFVMTLDGPPPPAPPLERTQRWNIGLVLLVRQSLQVLIVTLLIGVFFLLFGKLFIAPSVIESWIGSAPETGIDFELFGAQLSIARELALVAGFVSAFSGLYFAVYVSTDATYREEFHHDIADEVRRTLVVRRIYLALIHQEIDAPDQAPA